MIDMSLLDHPTNQYYLQALSRFNSSNKINRWTEFKISHLVISNNKCPICECPLDGSDTQIITRATNKGTTTTFKETIDHYRPTSDYPDLKYDHENYILMCSECNNVYKGSRFPLHSSTPNRDTTATTTSTITNEKPLIANPRYTNPYNIFTAILRQTTSGKKVIELSPKHSSGYMQEQAEETIRLFCLGQSHTHTSTKVNNCRINLQNWHFTQFRSIAIIMKGKSLNQLTKDEQKRVFLEIKNNPHLKTFSFLKYLTSGNYDYNIP